MAILVIKNGLSYIKFDESSEEIKEEVRILLLRDSDVLHSITADFDISSSNPLVISILQNPKILHDYIIANNINHVILQGRNTIMIKESIKVDPLFYSKMDSMSFIHEIDYNKSQKISAFTHVYNETNMLDLWIKYYGGLFGYSNIYVIDHGSTNDFKNKIPKEVNCVTIPRGQCDHWNISKYCGQFQRFLLTQYKWVINTDCDEFLMVSENNDWESMLSTYQESVNIQPKYAFDVVHDYTKELELNYNNPILSQRSKMYSNLSYIKTYITAKPTTWGPGFHKCYDDSVVNDNLYAFHLKMIDSKVTLKRNKEIWQSLEQTEIDKLFFLLDNDSLYQAKSLDTVNDRLVNILSNCTEIPEWTTKHL